MLSNALKGAVARHKKIARELINSSEKTATIVTVAEVQLIASGAPMFGRFNSGYEKQYTSFGPFNCVWLDADSARLADRSREAAVIGRYPTAEIVAKFWLDDVSVTADDPYGETYFDRSDHVVSNGKKYRVLGYDRYGLGVSEPYMISVLLEGSYTTDG